MKNILKIIFPIQGGIEMSMVIHERWKCIGINRQRLDSELWKSFPCVWFNGWSRSLKTKRSTIMVDHIKINPPIQEDLNIIYLQEQYIIFPIQHVQFPYSQDNVLPLMLLLLFCRLLYLDKAYLYILHYKESSNLLSFQVQKTNHIW